VALARGAQPLATDWYPQSLAFARANANAAGLGQLPTMEVDWSAPPPALFAAGPFDLVIGADVAYERRHASQLAALLTRVAPPPADVIIADPRRPDANASSRHCVHWVGRIPVRNAGYKVGRTNRALWCTSITFAPRSETTAPAPSRSRFATMPPASRIPR